MQQSKKTKILGILKDKESTPFHKDVFTLLPGDLLPKHTAGAGLVGWLQDKLKRHGKIYYFLVKAFSPVVASREFRKKIANILGQHHEEAVIVNIGSGPNYFEGREDIINVDLFAFKEVDVCARADGIPFRDGSVDLVVSIGALEHIGYPQSAVEEILRLLKPGGTVLCSVPFMQPFHAAPCDFHRWTIEGLKVLFSRFTDIEIGIGAGPTSGIIWVVVEWLALVFSFGNARARDYFYIIFMVFMSHIKYLDLVLPASSSSRNIASVLYIIARK